MKKTRQDHKNEKSSPAIPVIAVLGHVDHGKTTLLDAIRKTNVAKTEHGLITQKIGASTVDAEHEGQKRKITFIDTPGHEAFIKMRGRGAQASSISLLVVSSTDGVMPQTKESIKILKEAKIPFIVVLTKSDLTDKNPEKVKGQLIKEGVMLEGKGGDVPVIEVSAKTGKNIKELLDLILLVHGLHATTEAQKEVETQKFEGIIIESKLDSKAGPKATLVIKSGKLSLRDEIVADSIKGRVRSLINDKGKNLSEAGTGQAVEVLGFEKVPNVGSLVSARGPATRFPPTPVTPPAQPSIAQNAEAPRAVEEDLLKVVIVADSQGSLEAILNSMSGKVNVVLAKTGEVEASDVLFAKSTKAVILGFNTKIKNEVAKLAEVEKVLVRNYSFIYEILSEIDDFLEGKALSEQEKILGRAKILARFPFDKKEVLGVSVLSGRVAKGDRIRLMRDDQTIGESTIASLKQGKEQVSKVEEGGEAGILLSSFLDFDLGDMLISHS